MLKQKGTINSGKGEIKEVEELGIQKKKNKEKQILPIAAAVPLENNQIFDDLLDRFLTKKRTMVNSPPILITVKL